MSNDFQRGSLVKLKIGGPTMVVFGAKGKIETSPIMPAKLKEGDKDVLGPDTRWCFYFDNNNGPICIEIPAVCLEAADPTPFG